MTVDTNKLATRVAGAKVPTPAKWTVERLVKTDAVQRRFQELLGDKAAGFMSSIINVTNSNTALAKCEPQSVLASAAVAAALDLPIDPNLGFSYVVPYGNRAQFQLGYKGYIQLAMRTGAYKTINVCEVYEGELLVIDRFRGHYEFGERTSDKVVGYIAYYSLLNGFEKFLYMSMEEVEAHAKRYSKTYSSSRGVWKTNFDEMAQKTVLKRLLSKYGILSIEMQLSLQADQATVTMDDETEDFDFEYIDNGGVTIDVDYRALPDDEEQEVK